MSRTITGKSSDTWCACRECTLDGCIAFSEQQKKHYLSNDCQEEKSNDSSSGSCSNIIIDHSSTGRGGKRRRGSSQKSIDVNENTSCDGTATTLYKRKNRHHDRARTTSSDDSKHGYTYRHPIRIPKLHNMGSTWFFIILFNLALAKHLKVLIDNDGLKQSIRGVLHLYELIFEYWSRLQTDRSFAFENDTATSSLRFVMILFNNMSQMYKIVNNRTKHKQCLQNLQSIVMIAVECNTRLAAIRENIRGDGENPENESRRHRCRESFQQSIDGFLTNLMPPEQCAQAA